MAHQEQVVGVAAVLAGVRLRPGRRLGAVLQEVRVMSVWRDAIIRDHRHIAVRRQRIADEGVLRLLAGIPTAAVDEHHHGRVRRGAARGIDVEVVARPGGVGDVARGRNAEPRLKGVQDGGGGAAGEARRQPAEGERRAPARLIRALQPHLSPPALAKPAATLEATPTKRTRMP
jgi:hypothetical protein